MKVTPKTEAEIKAEQEARGPLPRGVYDAEIKIAKDTTSKAGNEMIALDLVVYDTDGQPRQMQDWLVDAMAFKVRHCAAACGLLGDYEGGDMPAWKLEGKCLKVKLGIDTKGERPRNKIDDYMVPEGVTQAPRTPPQRQSAMAGAGRDLDDEIPF